MVDKRCATINVVRPRISFCKASCTKRSDSLSSAEVASSKIKIGASLYKALAMASLCRCPPESWLALCPSSVSIPCGSVCTWAHKLAACRQCATLFLSGAWPKLTLAAKLSLSITTSWLTMANWLRRLSNCHSGNGTPSSNTWPLVGFKKRGNS